MVLENKFDPKGDGEVLLNIFCPKLGLCPIEELVCPKVVPDPSVDEGC